MKCRYEPATIEQIVKVRFLFLAIFHEIASDCAKLTLTVQENDTVKLCLEEFEKFDPSAESFRFSRRKDGVEIGQILSELDILLVSKQINQCTDILEGILSGIDIKIHYGEI